MQTIRILLLLTLPITARAATPWNLHTIDDSSRGSDGVRLADVNGDRLPDITTGWEEGGVIRVYLNPGAKAAKEAWPAVTVGKVKSPEDAVFVDLDDDGAVDVVSCCEGKQRAVFVHWAPKNPTDYLKEEAWKTEVLPASDGKEMYMFALPLDVDGRNGIDLVVGSKGKATIGWFESPADPRDLSAWKFHKLYDAGWIMSLQSSDMDADGDLDILATDRKGANRGLLWLENPGAEATQAGKLWPTHRLGAEDREVMFLSQGKLPNTAGKHEPGVAVAVKSSSIAWFPHSPGKKQEFSFGPGFGSSKGVAIGDVDLDGSNDLIFTCEHANGELSGAGWLRRESNGKWSTHDIGGPKGVKYDRIELIDLDDDGDLDLLTCEERDGLGVIWYENPTK